MVGRVMLIAVLAVGLLWIAGCEPQRKEVGWVNPLDRFEASLAKDPKDNNYILQRMEFGRAAMLAGCDLRAKPRLMEAFEQLGADRSNTAAALTTEQLKYYKGETYERAMLTTYLGMMAYDAGQFNDARILFSRALSADKAAVVKDTTPASYGEDFGLAYFWIGKAYARLGDADNATVAFRKAAAGAERTAAAKELAQDQKMFRDWEKTGREGELWTFKTFHDEKNRELFMDGIVNLSEVRGALAEAPASLPEAAPTNPIVRIAENRAEFFTPAYQATANLVCTIEMGRCPFKYLAGIEGERTEFGRACVVPRTVRVYVDGHYAGPAFEVLDLWDQAATQDRIAEKDAAQTGKAILKFAMSQVTSAASHWNVQGDIRHWTGLPGKVFVFAAAIAPGLHTVRLEMYDCCGNLLPRWTNTYWGMGVPKAGEACILLNPRDEGDNCLSSEQVRKALAAGAKPGFGYPGSMMYGQNAGL